MDVLLERIPLLIEKLENVMRRPHIYIGKIESKSLEHYLRGFGDAAHLFAHVKYIEKHLRIVEQVAYDRGWPGVWTSSKKLEQNPTGKRDHRRNAKCRDRVLEKTRRAYFR